MIHLNLNRATPNGQSDPEAVPVDPARALAILYENDAWLADLFAALRARDVPFSPVRMDDAAVYLDRPPAFPLVFNRVSPSSYIRGHGPAIPFARSLLDVFGAHGRRVVNGTAAFQIETSKVAQHLLFERLGVHSPRTVLFNKRDQVAEAARDFTFPAIIKPNCGGSGAFVKLIRSYEHLLEALEDEPHLFAPDHLLLLQEQVFSRDGTISRTEFIDGELVYAMRVRSRNTFNLCPADSCERTAADESSDVRPSVEFEPYPDIPAHAVAQAREIVRAAGLDVGGVEFIESDDGTRWFIDINATSVYRPDICAALGVDALDMLVRFIERELHKELAKRSRPGAVLDTR
jgi:glutathione synthase/RimK-type ligase-like ATP-grasp enzyme